MSRNPKCSVEGCKLFSLHSWLPYCSGHHLVAIEKNIQAIVEAEKSKKIKKAE
jgi:hypothetical protein